jgi:hypothetical protein
LAVAEQPQQDTTVLVVQVVHQCFHLYQQWAAVVAAEFRDAEQAMVTQAEVEEADTVGIVAVLDMAEAELVVKVIMVVLVQEAAILLPQEAAVPVQRVVPVMHLAQQRAMGALVQHQVLLVVR